MRGFLPVGVLIAAMAWAQMNSAAPAAAPKVPAAGAAANVAPDAAVFTIKGLCAEPAPESATHPDNSGCQTVVTRAQFDELVEMLRVEKDPQATRALMTAYPQTLIMAHEAERRGLEKEPHVQVRLRFARLQILSQELIQQLKEEAGQVPEKDIEDYYHQKADDFEQFSVERIVIPNRAQPKPAAKGAKPQTLDENGMSKLAQALRVRAAAGEDFSKLQKEAYDAAGLSGNTAPNPRMEKMRSHGLPPGHLSVFSLNPGEVSPVISDETGHYIYKLVSKEVEPLEAVKLEITKTLRRQRLEAMVHQVEQPFTTDVNHAYFGAEGKPAKN
jgi:parvulin-like peptidyl-prolyl cis-trans isomerase-like protein